MDKSLKRDIIQWDIKAWGNVINSWEPILKEVQGGKAACFGEREGGLSLWFALRGLEVECTDFHLKDELPLEIHVQRGVTDKVNYSKQDITSIDLPDNSYDIVAFKSVIGALNDKDRQQKAFNELYRILKPGGYLLFAENTEATAMHRYARNKFTSWGERWRYLQWNEVPEMLSQFSETKLQAKGFWSTFGRNERQRSFLSGIDIAFVPLTPKLWRYFVVGICKK